MYCHECGTQIPEALSYCKHCGANLLTPKDQQRAGTTDTTIDTLIWVIVGTTFTLLGMALGGLVLMKNGQINEQLGTVFVIINFVGLVLIDGLLVWRLLQLNRSPEERRTTPQVRELSGEEPDPSTVRALHEHLDPVTTLNEQTTRNLEPSHRNGERR